VSCAPTASASSATTSAGASSAQLSTQERERVSAVKDRHANQLLENPAIADVSTGASADNPQEGALVVTLREAATIPAAIDGVRTRINYADTPVPRAHVDAISGAALLNQAHAKSLMQQPGIQGVGIGISDDNSAEPAMVIYVISGTPHPDIPAVMDGLRTKIVEGDRFRAFGWGRDTVKQTACSQAQQSKSDSQPKLRQLPKLP